MARDTEFDGLFVLSKTPGPHHSPAGPTLRYFELFVVEQLFRTAKALLRTRPLFHQSDAATRAS